MEFPLLQLCKGSSEATEHSYFIRKQTSELRGLVMFTQGSVLGQIRNSDDLTGRSTALDCQEVYWPGSQQPHCLLINGHINGAWNWLYVDTLWYSSTWLNDASDYWSQKTVHMCELQKLVQNMGEKLIAPTFLELSALPGWQFRTCLLYTCK
jgi:hypothetical protein